MCIVHANYEMKIDRRTQGAANIGRDSNSLSKKNKMLTEWNSVGHESRSRIIIYEMLKGTQQTHEDRISCQ